MNPTIQEKMNTNYNNYINYLVDEQRKKNIEEHNRRREMMINKEILSNSLNTQTEVEPKQKFKILSKELMLVRITAILETNDHGGYCSDGDCEYKKKIVKVNTIVPESMYRPTIGVELIGRVWGDTYNWTKHLPVPKINVAGSGYCSCNIVNGVGQHKYKYTVKSAKIIENKRYKDKSKKGYLLTKEWTNYGSQGNDPYRHIDTLDEAKKIAKLHSCNIYDLDTMKKLISYP